MSLASPHLALPHIAPGAVAPYVRPALTFGLLALATVVVVYALLISHIAPDRYETFAQEDGFVEWLTVLGLLAVAGVLLFRWWRFRKTQTALWGAIMLLGAAAMIFGAGEEVSWGQRIFNWQTGDTLKGLNSQGETNLHNIAVDGVKLNKVIFTYGLGAVLALYLLVLPVWSRWQPQLAVQLAALGIPLPTLPISGVLFGLILLVLAIPQSNKWEVLEFVVPFMALAPLLYYGPLGNELIVEG